MSNYEDQTNDELREELDNRGLKVSGNKDELVARLEADDEAMDSDVEAADLPLTSAPGSPGRQQVVVEDGWTVQQGSWRKGSGDEPAEDE